MSTVEQLYKEAQKLSPADREALGQRILESVGPEFPPDFLAEIERRDEEIGRGQETVEWEQIRDEWRDQLRARATGHLA
jgi:hypothetical protein